MLDMIARSIDMDFNLFPRLGPRSDKDILLRKPDRFAAPPYSTSHNYLSTCSSWSHQHPSTSHEQIH